MRIMSIAIKNYRQYKELHLDFDRPAKRGGCDLNVLVGRNGFGKTNLANAFCWCLWSKEPDLALKDKNSGKPKCNLEALQDCKSEGKSGLEVQVAVKIDLETRPEKMLLIQRKCKVSVKGYEDEPTLTVVQTSHARGAGSSTYEGEEAQEEIERYYPSDLSDYLVFDGERLTTYFQRGQASKIQQSVINLSGIQKLDEAMHHHSVMMSELESQISDNSEELKAADIKRTSAKESYERNAKEIERLESEVAEADNAIHNLREEIGTHKNVPELLDKKDGLEALLQNLEKQLGEVRDKKCELIRRYYPIFAVMRYAPVLQSYVQQKQERQEYPPSIRREVFEEILKNDKCVVCGEKLSRAARRYVEEQIEKYKKTNVSTETYNAINGVLEPKMVAFNEQMKVYLERRDAILSQECAINERHERAEVELQDVRDKLAKVNDAQSYKAKIQELSSREKSHDHARDMLGARRADAARLLQEKQNAEAEYERVRLQSDHDVSRRRQYEILKMSWQIIQRTREKLVTEIREAIEEKTNAYWQELMWKPKEELGHVHFAQNFTVTLCDDDTKQQMLGTLSAAERAMMALSITWAIHSQAGINFPFIIDTPVANMSSDSRKDFAQTLKEISKDKQVILLFTDTEYVNEIPEVFGSDLVMKKTLSYSKGKTEIK